MYQLDAYATIGNEHIRAGMFLQDHVLVRAGKWGWQMALSDGCSGGGKTDVGARLLTSLALKNGGVPSGLISDLYFAQLHLGLEDEDMLATLLYADGCDGAIRSIVVFGDGVIYEEAGERKRVTRISFPRSMPFYLSYMVSGHYDSFLSAMKGERVLVEEYVAKGENSFALTKLRYLGAEEATRGVSVPPLDGEHTALILFSDGVESSSLPVINVVDTLARVKNVKGRFMARRINRQIARWRKEGVIFADDLSAAALLKE